MKQTVGGYLLDSLQKRGLRHIFGLPGDYVLRFNKMIEEHPIQFINTTVENSAGYMADAYARLHGLGAACITYGVGIGIANSVAQAYVESSPVVIISGAAGADEFFRCHMLHHLINKTYTNWHDYTQLEIFKQITGAQTVLEEPCIAALEIDRVLDFCIDRKKPVYIELPRDTVAAPIELATQKYSPGIIHTDPRALLEALKEIKSLLQHCKQPVIWAGHEIQRYGLQSSLLQFAEKFQIPIVSSLLGKTVISERHPLFVGVYQGGISRPEVVQFVEDCDCVFILGTILSDVETGIFSAKLQENQIIANAVDDVKVRHHHYQITFGDFIEQLAKLDLDSRFESKIPVRKIPSFSPTPRKSITVTRMFECIQQHLKPEHIIVTDIGDALFGSEDLILERNSFLSSAYFETLGFGAPGAIAAQLAEPSRRVIGIVGDGGFQMTAMELATAVRYKLDPIIIVLNNHGYGTERPILEGGYNDIQDWNYAKIPEVVGGGIGVEVRTEEEFARALSTALNQRGQFYLIEVELDKLDFSPAMRRFSALVNKNAKKD